MATYNYVAKNLSGEEIKGSLEAESLETLKKIIFTKGYYITSAEVVGKEVSFGGRLGGIKKKEFSVFCRQFAVILDAGITVVEAIEILSDQVGNKKMQEALRGVHELILKGKELSNALKSYKNIFPEFFTNMVQVGEASGSLDQVLNRLAEYYEKESKIARKVKAASMYPSIVSVVAIGVITLLMIKVIPMFTKMLSSMGGELPGVTKFMVSVSNFMVANLLYIFAGWAMLITAFMLYYKTVDGRYKIDGIRLKLPVIKVIVTKSVTAKFARSMGMLLKSGIPIITAIDIMGDLIENRVVSGKFRNCGTEVKEGKGISASLKRMEVFPPMLIHMVAVGENTGELDAMLTRTADFFDEELEAAIDQATTLIEPIMIIFLAVVVGTVLLAIMLPMASIMENIS